MMEYLPLIAFQSLFAAAGLGVLYRIVATKNTEAGRARHLR
ncbi:hypothetical protein [Martelella alba]|nr:hypothetical protein [Martelella alba]